MKIFSLILLFIVSVGCGSRTDSHTLVWDFSNGWDIAQVGWPKDQKGDVYEGYGVLHLTLTLADGRTFSEDAYHFAYTRKGNKVDVMFVHFKKQSPEEAYNHARALMSKWGFDQRSFDRLEAWHRGMQESRQMSRVEVGIHDRWPPLVLSITNESLGGGVPAENRSTVGMEIDFGSAASKTTP